MTRRVALCSFALVLAGLIGCAKKSQVDGQATKGGQPYKPKVEEYITVNLAREEGGGAFNGKLDAEGKFSVQSIEGGIPFGKYRVSLTRYRIPQPGDKGPQAPTTADAQEVWEVSSSKHYFNLDLDKYKWK